MIVRKDRHYYGLHLIDTAVTDTDPKSPNFLRIAELPIQLTSGRNLIKLYGNTQVFQKNSILYIEVLDAEGKVIYSEIPDFVDSGKRRLLIIDITDEIASGPALITVVSTLQDYLVPSNYRGRVNFKWQTIINVVKYESNTTEIIYETPPEVLLQTRIRPFVTSSFRNSEETSTREYGDYEFLDYSFEDYIGDSDSADNIYQKDSAFKKLTSFTSPSISSFNRNNVFYLKKENYSANTINRNYPDLMPGKGFFVQFGDTIVKDGRIDDTNLSTTPWVFDSGEYGFGSEPDRGSVLEKTIAVGTETYVGQRLPIIPGSWYLVSADIGSVRLLDLTVYLGYNKNHQSGSISQFVTASLLNTSGDKSINFILKASNGGPYIWFGHLDSPGPAAVPYIDNVRVRPLTPLGYDFKHESDVIGGYVKVYRPDIFPQYASDYTILPTYAGSQIISGSTAYASYIDFILQEKDAAVDDRFYYPIIPKYQVENPLSYTPTKHKIDKFISKPLLNSTSVDGIDFTHQYAREYSFDEPTNPASPLTVGTLSGTNEIYGTFYIGGQFGLGGIYKYDVINKQFSILYNFPGSPRGANPDTKPLLLKSSNTSDLYGTTYNGGRWSSGSLYKYNINTGVVSSPLFSFGRPSASGFTPAGPLMQASNGLLYGTTFFPQVPGVGYGVIYSFNTSSNTYAVVHQTASYGATNLIEHNGELWGATADGGVNGAGSIFRFNISTNEFNTEYSFPGAGISRPYGLVMGDPGVFYGITQIGNRIFSYDSSSTTYSTLYTLGGGEGTGCERPLLLDSGYLYGICNQGGSNGLGTVFRLRLSDNDFDVIHHFAGSPDGAGGKSSLIRIGNSLYGTNTNGGNLDNGAIFRIDRIGIFRPYVEQESGIIYHRNSIVPYEIPATSDLILDYPRWTGPVVVGGSNNLYSIIELEIRGLEPLTGDISKVQLYAKPKGVRSEFVDLGIYPTTPVDVLLDNNFVNHVQYSDSPYRLTGYFKPTITKITEAPLEKFSFETSTFLKGWTTGSITGSYFDEPDFHLFMSVSTTPESNALPGSTLKFVLNDIPTNNGLAYAVYTASALIPITASSNIWQQLSYNLFSAIPFPIGMDTGSFNYYTGSAGNNFYGLNSILVYAGLTTKTGSLSIEDVYAVSPNLNANYDMTGSSVSASSYAHPLTFNGKLGWKTDTFFIPSDITSTQSLYPALFFEYNTLNKDLLDVTIDPLYPHIVEVSNISAREVGDRDYIREKYWTSYSIAPTYNTTLIASASISANTDILMDSAKLSIIDGVTGVSSSKALAYTNKNKLVLQTVDSYKFYKSVPYIISFNAVSQLDTLHAIDIQERGDPNMEGDDVVNGGTWLQTGFNTITQVPGFYYALSFDAGDTYTDMQYDSPIYSYSKEHIIEVKIGAIERTDLNNPISLTVGWLAGVGATTQTINEIKPFTAYKFIAYAPLNSSGPTLRFDTAVADGTTVVCVTGVSIKRYNYDFINSANINPIKPSKSKLRVFGVNSNFGIPFADQLATPEIGEFIGELEHTLESLPPQVKNFGRVEMEFEAETDGFGFIAFESDLGATWYISDISVKPKDRVGSTPGVTRLFVKIPNDLVNKPLTFKVEYLNDIDSKAPYNTILNDVVFSNINEQQSSNKASVDVGSVPTTTNNSSISGPNTIAAAD